MAKYAILNRKKLKSNNHLNDAYKHNERIYSVANADPELQYLNQELVDANGRSYETLFYDTLLDMKMRGVKERAVRANAVRGFEVYMTFSREKADKMDIDAWSKASMEWLDKYYNPQNHEIHFTDVRTGEEKTETVQNIKHAVLHLDESNPHIHAFIVPIDERGNLNASAYDGRSFMLEMQQSYSKAMKQFGLEPGVRGSLAKHQDISRYYRYINDAVLAELPEPQQGETVEQYRERANEVYQTERAHHRDEIVKKDQEINIYKTQATRGSSQRDRREKSIRHEVDRLRSLVGDGQELTLEDLEHVSHIVSEHNKFEEAVEHCPNRDDADEAMNLYQKMVDWQDRQNRRQREKEREKREREERQQEES